MPGEESARRAIASFLGSASWAFKEGAGCPPSWVANPGLLLDSGHASLEKGDDATRGGRIGKLIREVARFPAPELYHLAYRRWEREVVGPGFAHWYGKVVKRIFIGAGESSLIDAAITLDHTYGVPIIPGPTLKGLMRWQARRQWTGEAFHAIAGTLLGSPDQAGVVTVHDAWWYPGTIEDPEPAPLAPSGDIVNPHHGNLADRQGKNFPSDMDEPVPANLVPARGTFLFAIEGPKDWAVLGRDLLRLVLTTRGSGRARHVNHGRVVPDDRFLPEQGGKLVAGFDQAAA